MSCPIGAIGAVGARFIGHNMGFAHTDYFQRAIAHGIFRGVLARVQGGNFGNGFISAFASTMFGKITDGLRYAATEIKAAGFETETFSRKDINYLLKSGINLYIATLEGRMMHMPYKPPYYINQKVIDTWSFKPLGSTFRVRCLPTTPKKKHAILSSIQQE